MFLTVFGFFLLLIPFLLVFLFKNRILGFTYVFVSSAIFHLLLAIISQFFHFFTYPIILMANIAFSLASLIYLIINRGQASFKIKFNWLILLAALIIFFELFSVHYFYTGKVVTNNGIKSVTQMSYPYPYFADDWAGVAFTNYTITNKALPIINPMLGNEKYDFPNIFVGFFAGLAELFLLLNLSPLLGFSIITILTGLLICFLVYLFLRSIKVETFFALIGALCLPWIVTSVNLPGIWYLFPFIGGTIFLLITLIFLSFKAKAPALISGLISLFLYPPFIVFVAPTLLVEFLLVKKITWSKILLGITSLVGSALLATGLVFILQKSNGPALLDFFYNSLIRINNEGCIPSRPIWLVIPWYLLPLATVGIYSLIKQKLFYFLIPLTVSLLFWAVYAYCPYFFIIDYARIAAIASFLLMIPIGLGASVTFKWLAKKYPFLQEKKIFLIIEILILSIFLSASFFYTQRSVWTKIVLRYDTALGIWERPTNPPANNFLQADDLLSFKDLKHQRFISPSWKGLVIGAATVNYPLDGKASIITNSIMSYNDFISISCDDKISVAKKIDLNYVYSIQFDCPNFKYVGHSSEGLYLYKFQP